MPAFAHDAIRRRFPANSQGEEFSGFDLGERTKTKSIFTETVIILKRDSAEALHFCFVTNY